MTRQSINLLGGLVVVAILLVGVFLGVLPRLDQTAQAHQDRDSVAMQNQTQQTLITAYSRQRQQLPALQAQVAALKQQIAAGPHLEQLIDVAANLPAGAVLRSITPQQPTSGASSAPTSAATPGTTAGTSASGFDSLPVTVVLSLRSTTDAPAVLDKLRSGPRLFAIDHVTLGGAEAAAPGKGKGAGATLTVTGRVFEKEGG